MSCSTVFTSIILYWLKIASHKRYSPAIEAVCVLAAIAALFDLPAFKNIMGFLFWAKTSRKASPLPSLMPSK